MFHLVAQADGLQLLGLNNLALPLHHLDEVAHDVIKLLCLAQELLALLLHRRRVAEDLGVHHVETIAVGVNSLLGECLHGGGGGNSEDATTRRRASAGPPTARCALHCGDPIGNPPLLHIVPWMTLLPLEVAFNADAASRALVPGALHVCV